jgi:hypothetical protein
MPYQSADESRDDTRISSLREEVHELKQRNDELAKRNDESVNLVAMMREEIQRLKDEIATLKKQKPRPKIPPSILEGPKSKEKQKSNDSRGKHPRKKKTSKLQIHTRRRIRPDHIPKGAVFKGIQKYTVQDVILESHNILYELERWELSDGTYVTGKLPPSAHGHYGATLISYVLHQYYGCRVTEPLLLVQLREMGVLISAGQLSNLLRLHREHFHEEKGELLEAGIAATGQIQTDDTGARHAGKNCYANVIGNEFFTSITTTDSKSRINFLQLLHGSNPRYLINEDTSSYIETLNSSSWLGVYLTLHFSVELMDQDVLNGFLRRINITSEKDVKLSTEGALFASLLHRGIPRDLGVHGDDAGQFNVFIRSLCWIHEERHYRKIVPFGEDVRLEIEKIRDGIWALYKGLKKYKEIPCEEARQALMDQFDDLFTQEVSSPTLAKQLAKTHAKKERLLKVLARPDTPLHNNGSETDVREVVTKRKVSGGTRSVLGLQCRDTFLSLKKTCCKLKISFWDYLKDRISGMCEIPSLAKIIAMRSAVKSAPS